MWKNLKYIFLIFILPFKVFSHQETYKELDFFYFKLYKNFLPVYEVEVLHGGIYNNKKIELNGPKNVFLPILRFKTFQKDYCLFYQKDVVLKLVEIEHFENCDGTFLKNYIAQISNINQVIINLKEFELNLKVNVGDISKDMNFKFYNVKKNKSDYKRYDRLEKKGILSSIYVIGLPKIKEISDGTICHDFDEKCEETTTFICDKCQNGWYEVVNGKCSKKLTKICGSNLCSISGKYACPKGTTLEKIDLCSNPSQYGFCQNELKIECDENKYLKCI